MKRLSTWILIAVTALFISACEIVVTPLPVTSYAPTLSSFSFYSVYQDSNGQSIVCDNYLTKVYYEFDYGSSLYKWTSALVGATTDNVKGVTSFYPRRSSGREYVEYTIPAGLSPLASQSDADALTTESIVVVPSPQIIGYSELVVKAYNSGGSHNTYVLGTLPVVNGC